jgi:hypothetical protein
MATDRECLDFARECVRLAAMTSDQDMQGHLLTLARQWMDRRQPQRHDGRATDREAARVRAVNARVMGRRTDGSYCPRQSLTITHHTPRPDQRRLATPNVQRRSSSGHHRAEQDHRAACYSGGPHLGHQERDQRVAGRPRGAPPSLFPGGHPTSKGEHAAGQGGCRAPLWPRRGNLLKSSAQRCGAGQAFVRSG